MVIHIKELFIEIINHYQYGWDNNRVNFNFYQHIPTIFNFNRISKAHYEWCKEARCFDHGMIVEIKHALMWLNWQILRKTVNQRYSLSRQCIKSWARDHVCENAIKYAVMLYNNLNQEKIIGTYSHYNICYPFIYPDAENVLRQGEPNNQFEKFYKNFPKPKEIYYNKFCKCLVVKGTGKKVNKADLQLLQDKPYYFKMLDKPY